MAGMAESQEAKQTWKRSSIYQRPVQRAYPAPTARIWRGPMATEEINGVVAFWGQRLSNVGSAAMGCLDPRVIIFRAFVPRPTTSALQTCQELHCEIDRMASG